MTLTPPKYPAGSVEQTGQFNESICATLIDDLRHAPQLLRETVADLSDSQLDAKHNRWTIRQIVHDIGDSHVHSYVRFKWALTEDNPTIKAYEEADWVGLSDSQRGDIEPSLRLLEGVHAKWVQTLEAMTVTQFLRTFVHPQSGETVSLWTALHYYPWHACHHTAQIQWLREHHRCLES